MSFFDLYLKGMLYLQILSCSEMEEGEKESVAYLQHQLYQTL